jgi:hypothetical protein
MAKPKRDPVREERIHEEVIVDAYQSVVKVSIPVRADSDCFHSDNM